MFNEERSHSQVGCSEVRLGGKMQTSLVGLVLDIEDEQDPSHALKAEFPVQIVQTALHLYISCYFIFLHFREPKYRQPKGTAEGLTGGLGGGHFSLSSTFLHNLGSTRRTSMTNLCHHYSSRVQSEPAQTHILNGNAIPAGYQGCISWAAFLVPPHTPTLPSCAGAPPGQGPGSPGTHPRPEIRRQKRKNPYPWTKEERNAKAALIASDMMRHCFLPSLSARPPSNTAPTIIPK